MLFNFSYKWISLKIPKMNPSPINIHFSSLSRMINPITLGEMSKQNELERNPNPEPTLSQETLGEMSKQNELERNPNPEPTLSQETLGIFSTVNKPIKDIEKELDKSAKIVTTIEDIGINCCVCYTDSTSFQFKTHCNHNLCVECLLQLVQYECPMCRSVFPTSIRRSINSLKNSKKNNDTDDDDYVDNNDNTVDTNQETVTIPIVIEEGPRPIQSYGFSWSGTPSFY